MRILTDFVLYSVMSFELLLNLTGLRQLLWRQNASFYLIIQGYGKLGGNVRLISQ